MELTSSKNFQKGCQREERQGVKHDGVSEELGVSKVVCAGGEWSVSEGGDGELNRI